VPFCLPKEFCFYGFACPPLLRITTRIAGFAEEKQDGNKFSLPTECRFIELPHSRCVAAINLNSTDL
jgi:hypothetical protein